MAVLQVDGTVHVPMSLIGRGPLHRVSQPTHVPMSLSGRGPLCRRRI